MKNPSTRRLVPVVDAGARKSEVPVVQIDGQSASRLLVHGGHMLHEPSASHAEAIGRSVPLHQHEADARVEDVLHDVTAWRQIGEVRGQALCGPHGLECLLLAPAVDLGRGRRLRVHEVVGEHDTEDQPTHDARRKGCLPVVSHLFLLRFVTVAGCLGRVLLRG